MKKYKFRYRHLLLVPIVVILLYVAWLTVSMIFNPMRRPAPMIRNHILRHTPIGICIEEAIEIIDSRRRWGDPVINPDDGFSHPSRFVDGPDGRTTAATVGKQSVHIRHRYSSPLFLDRSVRILWGFDENGKLIEVYVFSIFGY